MCELKLLLKSNSGYERGHTLTGVWVEIGVYPCRRFWYSHTLTGVWVEILFQHLRNLTKSVTPSRVCELKLRSKIAQLWKNTSHPHGCVSWNNRFIIKIILRIWSHPHGCVSWNYYILILPNFMLMSHPHGCVSWNPFIDGDANFETCHTLTGVWVEI